MTKNNESQETYLEVIYLLSQKLSVVRAVDLCEELGYVKSSVSKGLKHLAEKGYITVEGGGAIKLTNNGKKVAENVLKKHRIITEAFVRLGVDPVVAEENACRIEHVITDDLFEVLRRHVEKMDKK